MADTRVPASYSRQFAVRQPAAAKRPPLSDNFNVNKPHKRPTPWRLRDAVTSRDQKAPSHSQKTLVDAFKQHGMRLCDGARLNAVGKGVHVLGRVPPTVCASVTALYLSQNNMRSLEGIEQFAAVRLLSVGGNLMASDNEVARLNELAQLRNLNLMGNPLCDQPNYRLRVVAMLKKLQVLDNTDITKKEREAAPNVAAQDDALRTMVTQNHFDIHKLQRIAQLIALHKEFYGCVMAGVSTGRFDRVPSPNDVACNVKLMLRLWRYEDTLSEQEQEALRVQMLTIIMRTHAKLAENPKVKAKEYLLKLANGSSPRRQRQDGVSNDIKQRCASWEEAYANVIALQQKTIANLHAVCDKNSKEMVEFLKNLLTMDPRQRNKMVGGKCIQQHGDELEMKPPPGQVFSPRRSWVGLHLTERQRSLENVDARSSQRQLPPQQQDPDARVKQAEVSYQSLLPPPPPMNCEQLDHSTFSRKSQTTETRYSRAQETPSLNRKANFRSGDFANKSLGEAIHCFKLRDSLAAPPTKVSVAMPVRSNISQVHTIYTAQRQDDVTLPPELLEKQRPPFNRHPGDQRVHQSSAEFQDEMNKTRRDTEVATELNHSRRRVSSTFTREDLDMTSISEISRVSSSPLRSMRANEETYVPIAQSPPNPLSEVPVPVSQPLHTAQRSQSTSVARNEPQTHPEQPKSTAMPNDGRLQELEQREEKYIRALMQSEQRELDLRNNLSGVQRKLASYQRTLAQQLHERQAIKEEVTQRTMAVATPKILKRFFIRWIQFYNWSQQVKHVQRKRCFVVQHDHFWQWRRKVWMQQELRACLKKQQLRIRKAHFGEWANITRVSVIAKRSRMRQETRLLKSILHAWIECVNLVRREQKLLQDQRNGRARRMQRLSFREWKRTTRHKRALTKVQDLRWQDSERSNKQVAFWNWKLFLYSVARPIQERSDQLQYRVQCRQTRLRLREWRKLIQIDKMHRSRLRRRLWGRWVDWRRRVETEKHAAHKEKIAVAKIYFTAWHSTASEQATSRRSLNLAKRYVNRRRLRKLWMHWKYFSMAKRKYTQNSTKALKHYFIKLLRTSWGKWKQRTRTNLQQAKLNKYGILQRHFDAFRNGIRFVRTQKSRARMLGHAKKRREWSLLRNVLNRWREQIVNKKRCIQHAKLITFQRKQGALSSAWRRWRSVHVANLHHRVGLHRKTYDSVVKEKHELEAHLLAQKDTAMSLTDQIEILHERSKGEDKQVAVLEKKLRLCEEHNRSLAVELKSARSAIERERHAWEDALCEEEDKRENDSVKYRSLAQENQVLQVQMIELKRELEGEKSKAIEAEKINDDLRTASVNSADVHHSEMTVAVNKQKELESEIAELREHLKEQETEWEDTANRLQEYEKRIASTCEAMNEHEQGHERENERLRNEYKSIEAKLKEEQVKNTELNRLLQEKNQTILNMTHHISHGEASPSRDRFNPHPGHEHCDSLHGNQNDCGRRELRMVTQSSCRRHVPSKAFIKPQTTEDSNTVARGNLQYRTRSSAMSKIGKQTVRHLNPVRQPSSYSRSDELESSNEQTLREEEVMIDKHTSKVHEDIRLLQERISKRLEQVPAYAQLPPRPLQSARPVFNRAPASPVSSCSSLSNEDSATTDENQSVADRVRRARLRRLQTQKQAVITAVSPALAASRLVKSATIKSRDRENVPNSANKPKKKAPRKPSSSTISANRPLQKVIEKKKVARKQHSAIAAHAGRDSRGIQEHTMENEDDAAPTMSASNGESNNEQNDSVVELSLTITPPEASPTCRYMSETSPRSPKRSPTKQHANLLNIDPTATLAAISARLAIVVPPAESEIARINREALAAVNNRALNAKTQGASSPTGTRSPGGRNDGSFADAPQTVSDTTSLSSPSSKGGMTPALHDSVIAEEWVNLHLETNGEFLLPVSDIASMLKSPGADDDELDPDSEAFAFRKGGDGGPLGRAGMDRFSLYRMGMPKDLVDRLYRALYVYTNGFHNIINEIAAHCPPRIERHVSSNAWLTFLLLLEQCENGKYEMAMLKFKQAAQDAHQQLQDGFKQERLDLGAQLHLVEVALKDETVRGAEKSELIRKLVTETTESNLKISDQQQKIGAQSEQIRLLKLEVLVHEDEEKKLNEFLDDARRDYEVANSERLNALSERFALDEEIRKLSAQLERVEAEKANYARRMHETLFMNQALRANNDQLKQDAVVLGMDKEKVVAEKDGLQEQVEKAQEEISRLLESKIQVDKELIENRRKQSHLEARLQTMKEQFDIEVENVIKHQREIARLTARIDEERVQVGVLEAKCNLLTAEKPNTGMRAQDKLRIERLLNQKLELEAIVEANKLDRKRDEEQIWNLRSSLESIDAELQHNKRVYSAGQQAFLHSERTCEQLRQQTQELEKNYEKAKKNVASLKERFKVYETTSKEQITKLEVEVKVANAQLREITYVNRDNVAQIDQLTKSLSLLEKEATVLKTRVEESEQHVMELQTEKEDLQRNKNELDIATSTSRHAFNRFILSLQNMLVLVKLDEFPLDEAIRELLQMIQDTFGEELCLDIILSEDDKPIDIELEVQEDVTEEEQASWQRRAAARRKGIISIEALGGTDDDGEHETEENSEVHAMNAANTDKLAAERTSSQREIIRMSRFRKSKLDHLVNKLQRDIALKADLITNLESVVCDQSREISFLNITKRQQARVIVQHECQKGMLHSDLEMTTLMLFKVRAEKQAVEFTLEQVRIDQVLQTNRAFQAEVALATLRREFDMQMSVNEDLMAKIWRKYEYDLYMISLRRNKGVQATVTITDQSSQTLVPQRNPAMERPRVSSLYMPTDMSGESESLLQKISRATRELLPGVANEMDLHFTVGRSRRSPHHQQIKQGLVRPLASSPRSSRSQLRTQASHDESRRRHPGKRRSNASTSSEAGTSTLPLLDDNSGVTSPTMQLVHHVNEFGTRQNVLVSPTRPPFFSEHPSSRSTSVDRISSRPPALQNARRSMPRKFSAGRRSHLQLDTQYEERVESAEYPARQSARSPIILPISRQALSTNSSSSSSTLRYNRSFLRAGMEVLRNAGSSDSPLLYPGDSDSESSEFDYDYDPALSPSRLAAAVSGYNREQISLQEAAWQTEAQSPRQSPRPEADKQNDVRPSTDVDEELASHDQHSPFTPAVLYPILPNQ